MEHFFHTAETFVILSGSLAILTIFIWKLIRHEAGRDRRHGTPEKILVLVHYDSMTDDKVELRASLRLAITTIKKNEDAPAGEYDGRTLRPASA